MSGFTEYSIFELQGSIQDNPHGVRDVAAARQNEIAGKIARMKKKIQSLESECMIYERLFHAALAEMPN